MRKSVWLALLGSLAPTIAVAQTVSVSHRFQVNVSQQSAIGTGGFVDLAKVMVTLHTRLALRDANVYTSIYSTGPSGRTLVVTLGCHYGPLSAGQSPTYGGNSCDTSTPIPYAATVSWEADSVVVYTAATNALSSPVRVMPAPPR